MSDPLDFKFKKYLLSLREPLITSHGKATDGTSVFIRIGMGNLFGYGEAAADPPVTGETQSSIIAAFDLLLPSLDLDPFNYRSILLSISNQIPRNYAAKAAVDIAIHDLVAKSLNIPVYKLLGIDPGKTCSVCYTIGLDTIDKMVDEAVNASMKYKAIKVKLGSSYDDDIVREISRAVKIPVRVDINGKWSFQKTLEMLDKVLIPFGITMLEQPVPSSDLSGLKIIHDRSPIPVIVDESLYDTEGFQRVIECCSGIDVKVMRCGGIQAALDLISSARIFGLKVMIGCMIESSLGISAGAILSALGDYADLDLHLRLARDPFMGLEIKDGRFVISNQPGLGVELAEDSIVWD